MTRLFLLVEVVAVPGGSTAVPIRTYETEARAEDDVLLLHKLAPGRTFRIDQVEHVEA